MEKQNTVNRGELWNKIHNIISQIPPVGVRGDAMDVSSATTEIEELFYHVPIPQKINKNYTEQIDDISRVIVQNLLIKKGIKHVAEEVYKLFHCIQYSYESIETGEPGIGCDNEPQRPK